MINHVFVIHICEQKSSKMCVRLGSNTEEKRSSFLEKIVTHTVAQDRNKGEHVCVTGHIRKFSEEIDIYK